MQKGQGTSAQSSKISAAPLSKPAIPYNLIISLEELQIPVFQIVKKIIRPTPALMQEENVIRNKRPSKNQARSTASLTLSVASPERSARKEMSLCKKENYQSQASKEYRRYKEKQQFSKKVNKIFHKKYSYEVDEGENIDRLNAKLDKYIMRYLVGQKSTLTYQQ